MTVLTLPETFDQKATSEFSKSLMAYRGNDIVIDANVVSKIPAIGIELLIAALNQWKNDNHNLAIRNCSDAFLVTLETLGISREFLCVENLS